MQCKYFKKAVFLFALCCIGSLTLDAQENDSLVQRRIRAQQFIFMPLQCSSPSTSMSVLSRDYKLEVSTDSVIANLPYFGKSYTPQMGGSNEENTLVFSTTDFKYSADLKKKGKWEIEILPKDTRGVRVYLTIFSNGEAQMDITSPRRETMTYKGYVW